jgi:hypothetical protein
MEGRLRVCPACQGAWFRKAGFDRYEFWQKLHLVAASAHSMSLLVCLCGRPQLPNLSGFRPPTEDRETTSLLEAIRAAGELAPVRFVERATEEWRCRNGALRDLDALEDQLDRLEREFYSLVPRVMEFPPFGRRRCRGSRGRTPDSRGRDPIVAALQRYGVPFRRAGEMIAAVIGIWTAALARGEAVELPGGRAVFRNGDFRWAPQPGLFPSSRLPFLPERFVHPKSNEQVTCERCGSPWFFEAEFCQYSAANYGQRVGGDIHAVGLPQNTHVCLCGYPRTPGTPRRRRDDAGENFREAIATAQKHAAAEAYLRKATTLSPKRPRRRRTSPECSAAWMSWKHYSKLSPDRSNT